MRKTCLPFSALGIDQAHEQNNAQVKGKGGAIGLTQDPSALRRWTVGGPEVLRLLTEFEGQTDKSYADAHHEQYASFQAKFMKKCTALNDSFLQCENPFLHKGLELIILDTRVVVEVEGVTALYGAEEKGKLMYKDFVTERLQEKSKSLYDPIQRCQTRFFVTKKNPHQGKKIKRLQEQLQLSTRLFIIALSRDIQVDAFFEYENEVCPPSICLNGEMRVGVKSHLVEILEKYAPNAGSPSATCGVVFDGAALIHYQKPRAGIHTFTDYAIHQLIPYLNKTAQSLGARRIDIVWDIYSPHSIKNAVRDLRGQGVRRQDLPNKGMMVFNHFIHFCL